MNIWSGPEFRPLPFRAALLSVCPSPPLAALEVGDASGSTWRLRIHLKAGHSHGHQPQRVVCGEHSLKRSTRFMTILGKMLVWQTRADIPTILLKSFFADKPAS